MDVKTIHHSMVLPTTPHEVYEALMDSARHAAFTGVPANISRQIGGESTAYDGSLFFRNLELLPDKKLFRHGRVQPTKNGQEIFSTVTYELELAASGTRLKFTQEGVPAAQYQHYIDGWTKHYWTRLENYFTKEQSHE